MLPVAFTPTLALSNSSRQANLAPCCRNFTDDSLLAVAVLFGTGRPLLFTLAIICSIVYIYHIYQLTSPEHITSRPKMDQYKKNIKQMKLDGATNAPSEPEPERVF